MSKSDNIVHCRYPKCSKLHSSNEIKKSEAVMGGSKGSYYHPDCYHTMRTIQEIKDLFCSEINTTLTQKQIGTLISIANYIVFDKGVNVDFLKFAVEYFIKNKPGKIRMPMGLHYIIQDREVEDAWKKKQDSEFRQQLRERQLAEIDEAIQSYDDAISELDLLLQESSEGYKRNTRSKFSTVLGV